MSVEMKNNQFLSYLIILLSLFILILFTKDEIMSVQSHLDQVEQLNWELQKTRANQEELQKIALEVEQKDSVTKRYILSEDNEKTSFTEDEIINYFYTYADSINSGLWTLAINSINISPATENELWFFESTININAQVSSEQIMKWFLDYIIAEDSKYRFFIESYNHPFDGREGNFNMQLPLKIFYR